MVSKGSPVDMDLEDFTVVLNSDSEGVLVKGLRRFASQIRRDHGLEPQQVLPPLKAVESSQQSSVPTPDGRRKKQKGDDQLPADAPDVDAGSCSDGGDSVGTDEEDLLEEDATRRGAGAMEEKSEEEEEGGLAIERPFKEGQDEGNDIPRGAGGAALREDGERERKRKAAFLRAVEAGKAAGLLGEYLRGSPQLHDLLSLWDLDVRKSSRLVAAAHTDSIAAVLECLSAALLLHAHLQTAATGAAKGSTARPDSFSSGSRGAWTADVSPLEATGLGLCRKLIRDKIDHLHAQLSITATTPPAGAKTAGGGKGSKRGVNATAGKEEEEEERAAATLRLLTSVAKFHRLSAKELAGVFKFTQKAFVKIVSRRGRGVERGAGLLSDGASADTGDAAAAAAAGSGEGKRRKRNLKSAEMAKVTAEAEVSTMGEVREGVKAAGSRTRDGDRDLRHLGVDFLCTFMDSEDPALQMQMVTGSRGSCPLGLVFRGTLWRDAPATSLRVVETLQQRLLRNRRVSRRSKVDFFSASTIEHLRKGFDDSPPLLYENLRGLMHSLLCDPTTSPFLLEATPSDASPATLGSAIDKPGDGGGSGGGRDGAVVTSARSLVAGLACLGAHEDLGQRELLLSVLKTCPSLLGPYLRTFGHSVLEARPSYRLLQTHSLLSVVLREVTVAVGGGVGGGDGGGQGRQAGGEALLWTVMPASLTKRELTKGVLSGNPLLQASTMNLMATILDRSVSVAAASADLSFRTVVADMTSRLRQRMPEVQTLLGLRDRFGNGSGGTGGNGCSGDKAVFLRWRLLSLLERYAVAIPDAVVASRFDFLKLMASPMSLPGAAVGRGGGVDKVLEGGRGGKGGGGDESARRGLEAFVVELATLRLLAREGVVTTPTALGSGNSDAGGGMGGGSGGRAFSGWLTARSGGIDVPNNHAAAAEAENTPLGAVLRVATTASRGEGSSTPPTAIRRAARALAIRALQSMGIVTVPSATTRRSTSRILRYFGEDGGGGGVKERVQERQRDQDGGLEAEAEGEAGVWLDSLTPGALGALVSLAKSAFANAHVLMAGGIRAAMSRVAETGSARVCWEGSVGGDWEVEFSPLSMAAVQALAGVEGGSRVGPEAARSFCSAVSRVLHLHRDARPFAAVCVTFASPHKHRCGEDSGSGGGGENDGGVVPAASKVFRGLATSIARLVGDGGVHFDADAHRHRLSPSRERGEMEAALELLVKTDARARRVTPPGEVAAAEAAAAAAAARLSYLIEDSPGTNPFSLSAIVEELRAHSVNVVTAYAAAPAEEGGTLRLLLSRVSLPLPRLLADSLSLLEDATADTDITDSSIGEVVRVPPLQLLLLPAADKRVFNALVRRVSGHAVASAASKAAAVRQIVSILDLSLDRPFPGPSRDVIRDGRVSKTADSGADTGADIGTGTARSRHREEAASVLLSTGIRLAAAACLGLLAADGVDGGVREERAGDVKAVGVMDVEKAKAEGKVDDDMDKMESRTSRGSVPSRSEGETKGWRDRRGWRRHAFDALADVFGRPFLLRLALCPPRFDRSSGFTAEASEAGKSRTFCGGKDLPPPSPPLPSLSEVACTELSALVVASASAAAAASAEASVGGMGMGMNMTASDGADHGDAFVADAAAPFLEGLCMSVASAVRLGSPELRWLSPALIGCRRVVPGKALSSVLAALLERLSTNTSKVVRGDGSYHPPTPPKHSRTTGADARDAKNLVGDVDASARRLLEQLLAPLPLRPQRLFGRRWRGLVRADGVPAVAGGGEGVEGWGDDGRSMGSRSLVRGLDPTSVAALIGLQVASPSPELRRLVDLALVEAAGRKRDGSVGGDFEGAPAALTAAAAGLLDDESFFRHFFGSLVGGGDSVSGALRSSVEDVGDSCDARILEQLVRYCPAHAHRLAASLPGALRDLSPTISEQDASDAATTTLLAVRRPLEVLLRAGELVGIRASVSPPPPSPTPSPRRGGRSSNGPAYLGGGLGDGDRRDEGDEMVKEETWRPSATSGCCRGRPYPEAEALLPWCIVPLFEAAAAAGCEGGKSGTLYSCLDAVLEGVEGAGVLASGDTAPAAVAAAICALERSFSAGERSEERVSPAKALGRARARSRLFSWLKTTDTRQRSGNLSASADVMGDCSRRRHDEIGKAYLLRCLSSAAAAARAIGRASRSKGKHNLAAPGAGAAGGDERELLFSPSSEAEGLCVFLLEEVASVIGDAKAETEEAFSGRTQAAGDGDQPHGEIGAATGKDGSTAAQPPLAARLLGLNRHGDASVPTSPAADSARNIVHAFLTAVLKHRLGDAPSLLAARQVALVLYERHPHVMVPPRRGKISREPGMEEEDPSPFLAFVPEWSVTAMFDRVVGHSNFLAVLTAEGPSRAELLRLLVLLVSGGGVLPRGQGGEDVPPAAARPAGTALVRPLLALYGASLAEDDKLIARLLRLLQASGVVLDPSRCQWGPAAANAAAPQDVHLGLQRGQNPRRGRRCAAWLLAALDPRRLRLSVETFPVARELEPPPYPFEVVAGGTYGGGKSVEGKREFDIEEASVDTDGSESSSSSSEREPEHGDGDGDEAEKGGVRGYDAEDQELAAVDDALGAAASLSQKQVYDPCFLLPLVEWGLRTEGVTAQAVCECPLLGYIIMATSSLQRSTRAAAFACLSRLLDALQHQQHQNASSHPRGGRGAGAAFNQRPQLTVLLRCLRDGLETPLQRIPCSVALILSRASETLASNPGSDLYKAFNSFLLHRPYIRMDELPLFDTLFTGVSPGEMGRGAAGSASGGGGALGDSSHDPVSASKARLWILRALRDGMRSGRDLELAVGRRAVPLAMALVDSPVGDGDPVLVGVVLDVLGRVARLRRSGARYLINSIGAVAWCRVLLGRGLPAAAPPSHHGGSVSSQWQWRLRQHQQQHHQQHHQQQHQHERRRQQGHALPAHLQVRVLSLLEHLLRCGRWLRPQQPTLLEEEFALLGPDVVRCAVAAAVAEAAEATAGASHGSARKEGGGGKLVDDGRVGTGGGPAATNADLVVRSVSLLEELQRVSVVGGGRPSRPRLRPRPGRGMFLTLDDAVALAGAVCAVASPGPSLSSVRGSLKGRVVVLLASPGALETGQHRHYPVPSNREATPVEKETEATVETTAAEALAQSHRDAIFPLIAWSLAVAHDEVCARRMAPATLLLPRPALATDGSGARAVEGEEEEKDGGKRGGVAGLARSALELVRQLSACGEHREEYLQRGGATLIYPAPVSVLSTDRGVVTATVWSVLTLATAAAATSSAAYMERSCAYHESLWTTAVAAVLALLGPCGAGGCDPRGGSGRGESGEEGIAGHTNAASRTQALSSSSANPFAFGGCRGPLLRALSRELRVHEMISPREHHLCDNGEYRAGGNGDHQPNHLGDDGDHDNGNDERAGTPTPMVRSWAARTAARMLSAALPLPLPQAWIAAAASASSGTMDMRVFGSSGPTSPSETAVASGLDSARGKLIASTSSAVYEGENATIEGDLESVVSACSRALEALPPGLLRDEVLVRFVRGVGEVLRKFVR